MKKNMVLLKQNSVMMKTGSRSLFRRKLQKLMHAMPSKFTKLQKVSPLIRAKNNQRKLKTRAQLMFQALVMMNRMIVTRDLAMMPTMKEKIWF